MDDSIKEDLIGLELDTAKMYYPDLDIFVRIKDGELTNQSGDIGVETQMNIITRVL